MKISFKPMPGLTIAVVICLGILLTLGTWQYKRLIWKTDLLEHIDIAAHGDPLTSLAEINALQAKGEPLDFRRVSLDVNFPRPDVNDGVSFHLMRSNGKSFSWRLYQQANDTGASAYIATREFTEVQKKTPPASITGAHNIIGYVRLVQPTSWVIPDSAPATNRWFAFNPIPDVVDWSDGGRIETSYYIDHVEQISDVADLPVQVPEIPNNHLDYMLTWYSFAFIMLIIYALIHKKQGRLKIIKRE